MAINPRKKAPFVWDGEWTSLPPTLTVHHMAAIEGVKPDAIWDRIQQGRMYPKPIRPWRPYRWDRSIVQAERTALEA